MSIFAEVLGLTGPALLYPSWQVAFPTDNIHHPGDGPTPGVSPSMGPTGGILVGPVVSLPQCAGPENRDCHPPVQKAEPTCWNPGLSSRLIWVRHFGFNLKHHPVPSALDSRPPRPRWAAADVGGHVVTFVVTFGRAEGLKTKKPRFLAVF